MCFPPRRRRRRLHPRTPPHAPCYRLAPHSHAATTQRYREVPHVLSMVTAPSSLLAMFFSEPPHTLHAPSPLTHPPPPKHMCLRTAHVPPIMPHSPTTHACTRPNTATRKNSQPLLPAITNTHTHTPCSPSPSQLHGQLLSNPPHPQPLVTRVKQCQRTSNRQVECEATCQVKHAPLWNKLYWVKPRYRTAGKERASHSLMLVHRLSSTACQLTRLPN